MVDLFSILAIMSKCLLYSLLIACYTFIASPVYASITPYPNMFITQAIESGTYDAFDYVVDSIVVLGAEQYTMHYGRVVQHYVGSASESVEVLVTCDNWCEDSSAPGDTVFIVAQKQQYRYKVSPYWQHICLMYLRLGKDKINDKHKAVRAYCRYKKNKYSGHIDISSGERYYNSNRTVGQMINGKPSGVWLYQNESSRQYITYEAGTVCDTTYRFAFTKAGWQVVQKALTRGDTHESWSYGSLDRTDLYGIHLLKSYSKTTGSAPTTSTTVKYHSSGAIKSSNTRQSYEFTSSWRSNIYYKHGPVVHQYASGRDSLQGQYAYGHKVGTWIYYNLAGSIDSTVFHGTSQRGDTIRYKANEDYALNMYGTFSQHKGKPRGLVRIYRRGALSASVMTSDGLADGPVMYYRPDGTISEINTYSNGKLHGPQVEYNLNGSAKNTKYNTTDWKDSMSEIEYQPGQHKGSLYNQGHLTRVQEWKGDSLITDLVYERGLPTGVKGQKNGGYGTLVNGVHHGPAEVHDKNGRLSSYGNFYLGKKHGLWHERHLDEVQFREVQHW